MATASTNILVMPLVRYRRLRAGRITGGFSLKFAYKEALKEWRGESIRFLREPLLLALPYVHRLYVQAVGGADAAKALSRLHKPRSRAGGHEQRDSPFSQTRVSFGFQVLSSTLSITNPELRSLASCMVGLAGHDAPH
ncbi:hypothetical protein EVAR_13736_1 [Eumeta japonica]|uniref:Uncharacterized protein n=1 Tax=Eumeta variegata TaxID=151549 RepID=A0A4C1UBR3_EUMVA|nr:hypothetical protein EVAR_13736_1 [Eumeta japonica]